MALMAITPHIRDLENFLSHAHRRKYPNKTTIIHEGDRCETLYYIVSGSVSVVLEDEEGKEAVIAYLNPGDFFGEMALLHAEPRSATCRTTTPSALYELRRTDFDAVRKVCPAIQNALEEAARDRSRQNREGALNQPKEG